MADRIGRHVELRASPTRVWRALTDFREFGSWFGVALEEPFVVGRETAGQITYPGHEHLRMSVRVVAMEAERRFAFEWHPYAVDPAIDYSAEPPTLVEFLLTSAGEGTSLTVIESGFDRLPSTRRAEAFRMNDSGWAQQMDAIRAHVGG